MQRQTLGHVGYMVAAEHVLKMRVRTIVHVMTRAGVQQPVQHVQLRTARQLREVMHGVYRMLADKVEESCDGPLCVRATRCSCA